jgi:hypothetical protein
MQNIAQTIRLCKVRINYTPWNRLSPRYINIVTTRYNEITAGANSTIKPKRKKKEKKKRKQYRHRRIDENEDDPQPLRPSENSHHSPSTMKRRVPSSTSKKESDDHDAAARTNPRVSPGTLRGVGKRCTRRPSGRNGDTCKRHRVGVETTEISPTPKKLHPGRSIALYHSCHPPAHATTVKHPVNWFSRELENHARAKKRYDDN